MLFLTPAIHPPTTVTIALISLPLASLFGRSSPIPDLVHSINVFVSAELIIPDFPVRLTVIISLSAYCSH